MDELNYRLIKRGGGFGNARFHNDYYTTWTSIRDEFGLGFAIKCWWSNGQPVTMFYGFNSTVTVTRR